MSISHLLERAALLQPEVVAVDDGARRRTFGELAERAASLAHGLAQRGVGPGARVAIVARNRVEYAELYFALAALGAVCVPVNWRLHANEIAYVIEDSESIAVVVEEQLLATLQPARERCRGVRHWIALGAHDEKWLDFEAFATSPTALVPRTVDEREVAVQMYTSGTTGTPKGAMLTHRNVTSMVLAWLREIGLRGRESRFLQVTPLFHVGGMLQLMSTVAAGTPMRLEAEFLPGPALDLLERERITHALFVPAMLQWMLGDARLDERRFPALELIIYGAAPMPLPLLERALTVFRCGFLQGYGLTETCGVLTTLRPSEHVVGGAGTGRLASAGRAVAGCEVRVVDAAARDVAAGDVGEIVARGDNVFPGYWRRDEANREAFRDGWLRTGDLARVDAEGFVYVVDRLKDMAVVGGENVYPREIEVALLEHAAVADVAVIGIPHDAWGEEVLALVVLRPDATAGERELIQHCRARLARFKCPTRVEFINALPRNAAGKCLKALLREPYWRSRERKV